MAANVVASAKCFGWTDLGFSFRRESVRTLITPDLLWSQATDGFGSSRVALGVAERKIHKTDGRLWFLSFALPRISPLAYTLAYL